jgi:hypothetical protein
MAEQVTRTFDLYNTSVLLPGYSLSGYETEIGISKAFYKIACNGNKPNVVSWAKIVESSALYVLGMGILFTVIFLLKPVAYIYKKIPEFVQDRFKFVFVMVSVTLKLMVIYILLRMITVMIENYISNKIVFFLSKLNNNIEPPPVDCNAEEEENAALIAASALVNAEVRGGPMTTLEIYSAILEAMEKSKRSINPGVPMLSYDNIPIEIEFLIDKLRRIPADIKFTQINDSGE